MNENSIQINLTKENSIDYMKQYLDVGFNKLSLSIKDAAYVHKVYRLIKGTEKEDDFDLNKAYESLFNFVNLANKNKAYTLDEVAVLDNIMTFIKEKVLDSKV